MSGLSRLNALSLEEASTALLRCCGSRRWAERVARERPFKSFDLLRDAASKIWWALDDEDWLEAFAAHPEIGDRSVESSQRPGRSWERGEQQGARDIRSDVRQRLAVCNEAYRARFGFIFIICATGKSAVEMLDALESRLANDRADEIRIAAGQQQLITEIRLKKLLAEFGSHARPPDP